jgi:hypothetical protein
MVSTVQAATVVDAWKSGSKIVLASTKYRLRNLVAEIADPTKFESGWLKTYDPISVGSDDRLSVVAKVLFPPFPRKDLTRAEYYSAWANVLQRARKRGNLHSSWGSTYFERLVSLNGS